VQHFSAMAVAIVVSGCCASRGTTPDENAPSFRRDVEPVLVERCSTAHGCHGADPTPAVDLDLRPGAAYGQLVGVPAETGPVPFLRVAPGDPDRSLLLLKVTGALGPGQGKRMPLDRRTHEAAEPMSDHWIGTVLARWIEIGAPRD
jgi:hypothetical protein